MYSALGDDLEATMQAWLEEYEREHGIAIAVSRNQMSRSCRSTAVRFKEQHDAGLVIMPWAAPHSDRTRWAHGEAFMPGTLFADGEQRRFDISDRITFAGESGDEGIVDLYADDDAFPLAQVEPGIVYYPFPLDLVFEGASPNLDVVLGEPVRMALDPGFAERTEQERTEQEIERFRSWHSSAPERRLRNVRERVDRSERVLRQGQNEVRTAVRDLRNLRQEAEVIKAQQDIEPNAAAEEWRRLREHPRVRDLTFEEQMLTITTDYITLRHPHGEYEALMGSFKIQHELDGGGITFVNLDSPRNGRPHPHIDEGGMPCFGEMSATFDTLLAEGNYIALLELELEFLESYNPRDDWGQHASRWIDMPYEPPLTLDEIAEAVTR